MNTVATNNAEDILEARPLTNAELEEVNGGLIFAVLGLALAFEAGMLGGAIAANYATTGNFWGDID